MKTRGEVETLAFLFSFFEEYDLDFRVDAVKSQNMDPGLASSNSNLGNHTNQVGEERTTICTSRCKFALHHVT